LLHDPLERQLRIDFPVLSLAEVNKGPSFRVEVKVASGPTVLVGVKTSATAEPDFVHPHELINVLLGECLGGAQFGISH
jgi:hypothetical protein